jgi:hypothetical protein
MGHGLGARVFPSIFLSFENDVLCPSPDSKRWSSVRQTPSPGFGEQSRLQSRAARRTRFLCIIIASLLSTFSASSLSDGATACGNS